jgi:Membrane proteins related to metalloendopeptidases
MQGDGISGSDLSGLSRDIKAEAARIQRRAGKAAGSRKSGAGHPRGGTRRALAAALIALLVLIALPPFAWPLRGRVTSPFFFRQKPDSSAVLDLEFHRGLDIAAPSGTPVHATAPGLVFETGHSPDLGNYVRVRHLFGLTSTYGHLSRIDCARGQLVLLRGLNSLGAVGATGRATGPHLHFAIQAGGAFLPPRELLVFHSLRRGAIGF